MDLTLLERTLADAGEPAFRAKQIWEWTARGAASYETMTNIPAPLATLPYELPIPSFSRAARASGFADDNLTEPVVRSMPMFVECDGRIFAQWGLSFACVWPLL